MLKFSQIRQYTQTANGIRWDRGQNDPPFMLFYFSENSIFLKDFPKLNLLPRDVRIVVYPNMRLPRIRLTSQIAKMYRDNKLLVYSTDLKIPENKNIILDFTPYLKAIDLRYNPMDYRKRAGNLIQIAMRDIFNRFYNYRKVLLYSTDITQEIPDFINKKLFLLLKQMRMPDAMLPFDDMFFVTVDEVTAKYRLVVKNKEYKFNRIFFYFRNVLQREIEEETNKELENVSQNIMSKIEDKITVPQTGPVEQKNKELETHKIEDKKRIIAAAIKSYLKQSPKKIEKLVSGGEVDETTMKRLAVAAILYRMSGDLQKSNNISRQIEKKKLDTAIKILDKNYVDELLPRKKLEILTQDIVIKNQDLGKKVDNKYPNHLFEKRKLDFEINLNKDMINAFKVLETKDVPLKLESLNIEPIKQKVGELEPTDKSVLKAVLKDEFGNIHNVTMELPQIGEDGTFKIYGKRKCLINQIVLCPISFLKPYMAKFESSYAIFTIWSKRLRTGNRLRIFIGSLKMPLLLILAYKYGFEKTLKDYDIGYKIIDTKPDKKEIYSMKLQNNKYLVFENIDTELKIELCNSFLKENVGSFPTQQEFGTKEYFAEIIIKMTGRSHSTYLIDNTLDNIVDPVAKLILTNQQLPTDLDKIIKYMAERVVQGYVQQRNDLSNQRIRNSEILVHLAQKQILAAYTVYREQILAGNKEAVLKITPTNVLKDFIKTEIVMEMEYSNPIEEMSFITRVSPVGKQVGGIPSKTAFQLDARSVHPSYFGNIDPLDTPEGPNIGIVQQLAIDANVTTIRGLFQTKKIDNNEKSGVLSVSTSMTPFIECNDGVRTIMAANQSRQMLPLKNPEPPAVQTGYEAIFSSLLSKNFVKKSPVDGKVISIEKDNIVILKDGKKYNVDITLRELRSGSGKNTLSIFTPVVKVGQNVKKGQLLAEGACLKNGVISMGRNLLCAVLPYRGYNFEDGIIINKRLFDENKLTSLHLVVEEINVLEGDRITFINTDIGSYTNKGDHLLRKTIGELDRLLGVEESDEENDEYVAGQFIKKSPGGKIVDIEIFSNVDANNYPQIKNLMLRTDKLHNRLKGEKYTINEKAIDGILIRYKIQQELSIMAGDKLCNRHGNKGIVSLVEEDERMPRTPWGEAVDIVFNPLGIINRMNIGQLYEMYCGLISKTLANLIIKNKNKKYTVDILTKVLPLLSSDDTLPETKKLINSIGKLTDKDFKIFLEQLSENGFFPIVVTPFKSPKYRNIKKALQVLGLETGYKIYIPDYGYSEQKVPIGYMYIAKLEHMGDVKIHARSTGPVVRKLGQPTGGKRLEGGQRLGEMDTWSLASYNALKIMQELMGPLSDDQVSKNEMISEIITTGKTEFKNPKINPTKDLLNAYFIALMLEGK